MGLLDDAIREHLDLKRRRGADPAEIERAEREALGPVRRNREVDPDGDAALLAEEPELLAGSARDEDDEGIASDLAEEFDPVEDDYETDEHVAFAEGEPFADRPDPSFVEEEPFADRPDPSFVEEEPVAEDTRAPEDEPASLAEEDPPEVDDDGPRTELMRTVDLPAPEESDEDEDVLEETPEFLQDTPDHDRLWFEQRPPRDFDFDG